MDPLLRQPEQTSELGRQESTWNELEGLSQPRGADWKPDGPLGADAELGRSLEKVVQQLQWLQAQREATAIDGQVLQSSLAELVLPEGNTGSNGGSGAAAQPARTLLVIDTGISNWQQLSAELPPHTDLLLLEQGSSGLQQITDLLNSQPSGAGYGALVLTLPQTDAGSLRLGCDQLNGEDLSDSVRQQLEQWSRGLRPGAQLSLVVAGADTAPLDSLLDTLHQLTGADTALTVVPVAPVS
jgi:hypothetical protein